MSPFDPGEDSEIDGQEDADEVRCVCLHDEEGLMIQCDGCDNWCHTQLVGVDRNNIPGFYLCPYCCANPECNLCCAIPDWTGDGGFLNPRFIHLRASGIPNNLS